jgi:transaldolase
VPLREIKRGEGGVMSAESYERMQSDIQELAEENAKLKQEIERLNAALVFIAYDVNCSKDINEIKLYAIKAHAHYARSYIQAGGEE